MKNLSSVWPIAFAAVGVAGFVVAGLRWFAPPEDAGLEDEPETPITDPGPNEHFEPVRKHLVDEFSLYRGQVLAGSPVPVRAPQGLRVPIVKVHHEQGDVVKKGDVLFSLHKPQIDAAIARAEKAGDTVNAQVFRGFLDSVEIKAPCDGVVDQIYRTLGEVPIDTNAAGQGAPLATIQDADSYRFVVTLPSEVQRRSMPLGAKFDVVLDDDLGHVQGTVTEFGAATPGDTKVTLLLAPHAGIVTLAEGSVRVASGQREAGLVPKSAVVMRGDVAFIRAWDPESHAISERSLSLGGEVGTDCVVLAGAFEGDTVVVPGPAAPK